MIIYTSGLYEYLCGMSLNLYHLPTHECDKLRNTVLLKKHDIAVAYTKTAEKKMWFI